MAYFLIKEDQDYSDEFNLQGFMVIASENTDTLKGDLLNNADIEKFPATKYFGSNEMVEVEDEYQFWEALEIQEITEEEFNVLLKLFPKCDSYAFGLTALI